MIAEIFKEIHHYIPVNLNHTRKVVQKVEQENNADHEDENQKEILVLSEDNLHFGDINFKIKELYKLNKKTNKNYQTLSSNLLREIGEQNFHKIDVTKVFCPESRLKIVSRLKTFSHIKNLAGVFKSIVKDHESMYDSPARFDDEIYKYMNLKEVESVSHAIDTFETFFVHKRRFEIIFFNYYNAISKTEDERELYTLFKKFKEEVDSKKKNFTQRSFLHSVGNLIMGFWDPHLGALSRLLNKCLLLNTYRRNALDEKLFIDFLKKPCESCWFEGLNKK